MTAAQDGKTRCAPLPACEPRVVHGKRPPRDYCMIPPSDNAQTGDPPVGSQIASGLEMVICAVCVIGLLGIGATAIAVHRAIGNEMEIGEPLHWMARFLTNHTAATLAAVLLLVVAQLAGRWKARSLGLRLCFDALPLTVVLLFYTWAFARFWGMFSAL